MSPPASDSGGRQALPYTLRVPTRIAFIVSPHGFGHAARAAAVIEALHRVRPDVRPQIFTRVPTWFWEDSLTGEFDYHDALTDVGMVQKSPIEEDPAATLSALEAIRPLEAAARGLASDLERLGCELVVCDISPLGLAAAKQAGIPSILVESFTWDWIYEPYFEAEPGLREVAREMGELFDGADLRIQTEPVGRPFPGAWVVPPVSRRSRASAEEVRDRLGLDDPSSLSARPARRSWISSITSSCTGVIWHSDPS